MSQTVPPPVEAMERSHEGYERPALVIAYVIGIEMTWAGRPGVRVKIDEAAARCCRLCRGRSASAR